MSADRSVPSWSARHVAVVALLVVVVLSGCGGLLGEEASLPDGETAADAYRSLDGYTATVQVAQSDAPNRTLRLFVDVDGNRSRTEFIGSSSTNGSVVVYNGSSYVRYNATQNEYAVVSVSGSTPFDRGANRIADAVKMARESGTTTDQPPVGGAPLPVVPDSGNDSVTDSRQFTVSYEGTETVLGREAHVLRYEAAGDRTEGVLTQTVWMDAEYFITLKATQEARFDDNLSTYSFEMTDVTFEPNFAAGRFAFDPPPGATLNRSASLDTHTYETRDRLAETTDISVPDSSVPEGFELASASRIVGPDFTAVELAYREDTATVVVTKTTDVSVVDFSEGEEISVGDEPGVYRSAGTEALVSWRCEDNLYVVSGTVQKETLLDVARSIECE